MIKRLEEIIEELDGDIYWKNCNFITDAEADEMPTFYSRDLCRTITFRELLAWYLPRLGSWQDEPVCHEGDCIYRCEKCNHFQDMNACQDYLIDKEVKKNHIKLFLELIDIYSYYQSDGYKKYHELKDKICGILAES